MAFSSGTVAAWLYDTLQEQRLEEHFQRATGTSIGIRFAGMVVGSLLASAVARFAGPPGPIMVGLAAAALSMVFAASLPEPQFLAGLRGGARRGPLGEEARKYLGHIRKSVAYVSGSAVLVSLAATQIVVQRVIVLPQNLFAQPYFADFGWLPERIALVYVVFRGAEAIFAQLSHRVTKLVGRDERLSLLIYLHTGRSVASHAGERRERWLGIGSLRRAQHRQWTATSLPGHRRQPPCPSAMRASVLSTMNMGLMISAMIVVPVFGHIADVTSLRGSVRVFQIVFLALLVPVFVWGWRTLKARSSVG